MAKDLLSAYKSDPHTSFLRSEDEAKSFDVIGDQPVFYFLDWLMEHGFVVAPLEPTKAMVDAAYTIWNGELRDAVVSGPEELYRTMVKACQPTPPLDIFDRLRRWLALKQGEFIPPELLGPNGWGPLLHQDITDAIAEIERLRP